jgi:cation diffusion facilitator CzcD-associated flavoprotein CzcO
MSNLQQQPLETGTALTGRFDAVIVGAGFSGLYLLHRLRKLGMNVQVYEAGSGLGGTWFWNRYPGARCDVESMEYSFSFSKELQQEWEWTERYATQPEILKYLNHIAERFDLLRDIQFNTRVNSAVFDETSKSWTIETEKGEKVAAQYCIVATGCLSAAQVPNYKGLDSFAGKWYHTGKWPHEGVDFTGKRVAVIGTGSSAIQSIPIIAQQAEQLYVFQRTANFSVPAHNAQLDPEYVKWMKEHYDEQRQIARETGFGLLAPINDKSALEATPEERQKEYEARWARGGLGFMTAFSDLVLNKEANDTAAEFFRAKIRTLVKDPKVAELLTPKEYPIATKRLCVDINYYETYNRDNVTLVDLKSTPIEEITPKGIKTSDQEYEVDSIVFATGFDAMTGAIFNIDVRGKGGKKLKDKWAEGPRTYLGIATAGFPNLFMVTGPGSPSVLSNMMVSIEQHVDWITDCLKYLRDNKLDGIEATTEAEEAWVAHVNEVANFTLFPMAKSWYMGANIPGKPRIFMPYIGGVYAYRQKCDDVAAKGYEGFALKV